MERMSRRFAGIGRVLAKLKPGLEKDLGMLDLDITPEAYAFGSFLSALMYGLLFFSLISFILGVRTNFTGEIDVRIPIAVGISFLAVFFMLHLFYPKIISRKISVKENKDLMFALRDIMMMVQSGVLLFDAMKSVAKSRYGYAAKDFERVIRKVEAGMSERDALKELALTSENEYMKRASWQLVNALESGATIDNALTSIVDALENQMYRDIKNYAANLNFMMLIYMMIAAAMPSLGITFLALLSAFSGMGITTETIWLIVGSSAIGQVVLIGYMTTTRPEIFGG